MVLHLLQKAQCWFFHSCTSMKTKEYPNKKDERLQKYGVNEGGTGAPI